MTRWFAESSIEIGGISHILLGGEYYEGNQRIYGIDSKKRVTLRGAQYQYYNVKEYQNGCIILEPRELTVPEGISQETMRDMDRAIANFKKGKVSAAIDLSDF